MKKCGKKGGRGKDKEKGDPARPTFSRGGKGGEKGKRPFDTPLREKKKAGRGHCKKGSNFCVSNSWGEEGERGGRL